MPVQPSLRRRVAVVGAIALLAVVPVACGDDDDDAATPTGDSTSSPGAPDDGGGSSGAPIAGTMPEECGVFIGILEPADPTILDVLPADWPEPPPGSILCSGTETGGTATVQYATDAAPDDVLAHYEAELGAEWDPVREAGAGDEILTGYKAAVGFQVQPRDGGFRIALSDDAA